MQRLPWITEQITAFREHLLKQRSGFLRTALACLILFPFLATVTIITRATVFGVIAAYFVFFAWERVMQWRRVSQWLSTPLPLDETEMLMWAQQVAEESNQLATWQRVSHWVAGLTALALLIMQTALVWFTGGFWMKMLYGVVWAAVFGAFIWQRMGLTLYTARVAHTTDQPSAWDESSPPSSLWDDTT